MNIFLIGYRCSGKTITGQTIAAILKRPFVDTDFNVVEEEGMTISQIVDKKGWDYSIDKDTDFKFVKRNNPNFLKPWFKSPVALQGKLFDSKGKKVNVELVPEGCTVLRRVTFPSK